MSSLKKITLKSSDGEAFVVDEAVALKSQTIKPAIEDTCADNGIPLPNVTSKILAKVIEYCKNHVEELKTKDLTSEDDLKRRDTEFVKVDQTTLYDLIMAADYLNIKSLLDLTFQFAVDMIKGKTPEEIHESQMLKHMIELIKYYSVDKKLYLPSFSSKMLAKVIDYRKKHVEALNPEDRTSEDDVKNWDTEFVKVDQATLFDLILAAKFWNIKSLRDLTNQTVADMIKGKPPEEIRKFFNIKEDLRPEQEEEVRRENQWAFE